MLPILLFAPIPSFAQYLPPRQAPETEHFLRTAYRDIAVVIRLRDIGCRSAPLSPTIAIEPRIGYTTSALPDTTRREPNRLTSPKSDLYPNELVEYVLGATKRGVELVP
jgi:hypothetical protein